MTIIEAINAVDALKPNTYTQSEKVKWLSAVDGLIYNNVISTHENPENIAYSGYSDDTPLDTELIAKAPYDELYVAWLASKIDYYNGEYNKYNNSVIRFNDEYSAFSRYYNRTYMPKQTAIKYFTR